LLLGPHLGDKPRSGPALPIHTQLLSESSSQQNSLEWNTR
jgi:hypothetical protein